MTTELSDSRLRELLYRHSREGNEEMHYCTVADRPCEMWLMVREILGHRMREGWLLSAAKDELEGIVAGHSHANWMVEGGYVDSNIQ